MLFRSCPPRGTGLWLPPAPADAPRVPGGAESTPAFPPDRGGTGAGGGIIKYGGEIGFTTAKPEESSSFENGVSIWFDDTDVGKFNMNNDKWVDL